VILHVRDMSNPAHAEQKAQVLEVLAELGVTGEGEGPKIVEAWNKWDLLDADRRAELAEAAAADGEVVPISAVTGFGCDTLLERLGAMLTGSARLVSFTLPASDGQKIAWLHAHGEVLEEEDAGEGDAGPLRRIAVKLTPRELGRFASL